MMVASSMTMAVKAHNCSLNCIGCEARGVGWRSSVESTRNACGIGILDDVS
jgi:hypothetical protein